MYCSVPAGTPYHQSNRAPAPRLELLPKQKAGSIEVRQSKRFETKSSQAEVLSHSTPGRPAVSKNRPLRNTSTYTKSRSTAQGTGHGTKAAYKDTPCFPSVLEYIMSRGILTDATFGCGRDFSHWCRVCRGLHGPLL
jgi:hypothetical protein